MKVLATRRTLLLFPMDARMSFRSMLALFKSFPMKVPWFPMKVLATRRTLLLFLGGDLLIDLATVHISVGFSGGANNPISVPLSPPFG